MSLRRLMIDGDLAAEAEEAARLMGYESLDRYVMDLLAQDLDRAERTVRLALAATGSEQPVLGERDGER